MPDAFRAWKLTAVLLLAACPASAWGLRGHQAINRSAVRALPADGPVFLKAHEEWIAYLSIIPDTWRRPSEPFAKMLEDPNHGWFREQFLFLKTIPRSRYEFVLALYDEHKRLLAADPEAAGRTNVRWTGTLPYAAAETWDRLVAGMRLYRRAASGNQETRYIEMQIAAEMGRLGHYTGDGAMPLHVSIHHDGWQGPNPKDYTRDPRIHGRFESSYVDLLEVTPEQLLERIAAPRRRADAFDAVLEHLDQSFSHVEAVYVLDKAGAFARKDHLKATELVYERLTSAAQLLRDLVYSAWLQSASMPQFSRENPTGAKHPSYNPATGSAPAEKAKP